MTNVFTFFIPRPLAVLILLYLDWGNIEVASALHTQIILQPFWGNSRWYAHLYGDPIKKATKGKILTSSPLADRIGSTKDLMGMASLMLEQEIKK